MARTRRVGGVYAVRRGRQPGIYEEWCDAQQEVEGFSGAEYRWCPSRQAAEEYLGHQAHQKAKRNTEPAPSDENAPWERSIKWEWLVIAAMTPLALVGLGWIVSLILRG